MKAAMMRAIAIVVAALFLATGPAHARDCDTTHTSDLRAVWRCGNVCVHLRGPPHNRDLEIEDFDQGDDGGDRFSFKMNKGGGTPILNGKRCKRLQQTYPYDKEQK